MTQPETQLGAALKTALNEQPQTPVADPKPTQKEAVEAPAANAVRVAKAPAVKAAPAVAKAAPAKTPAKDAPAEGEKPKLNVGAVVAQAAIGGTVVGDVKKAPLDLPPHLIEETRVQADNEGQEIVKHFTLEIFGSGCLNCRALVDDQELEPLESLPKCHFQRGFSLCPAKHITIRAIGEQRMMARKLTAARDEGNVMRFTRLMADLSQRDADFQAEVLKSANISLGASNAQDRQLEN